MKRSIFKFSAVALTAAMALVSSCKEKDEDPTLSVDVAAEIVFSADGATLTAGGTAISATFDVSTNQKEWNVALASPSTWLTVTGIDKANKKFTLTAARNTTLLPSADATVTVTAGEAPPKTFTVKQAAALPFLDLSSTAAVVINPAGTAATSGSLVITVSTNYPSWKAESDKEWLKATEATDKFTLSAAENYFTAQKTATVTVTAGMITKTVQVSQSANPNGMTAASMQTWKVVSADQTIKMEWSDYIEYDGKSKLPGNISNFTFAQEAGDYRNNPGYKGYVYDLAYVQANQTKICPSPWRVPSHQDIRNLDIALGGTGENQNESDGAEAQVGKYVAMGFEFSGRWRNANGGEFQLAGDVGYLTTNETATTGDTNKTSHLMFRKPPSQQWAVYPENAPASSQDKTTGLPLRCVKDVQ